MTFSHSLFAIQEFPYGTFKKEDIQITRKAGANDSFEIKAGQITGQASLEPAFTESAAETLVSAPIVGVKSTFKNSRAPYAGQITAEIDCGTKQFVREEYLKFGKTKGELVLAVASARKVFGICSTGEVKFAAAVFAAYDAAAKRVVSVKLFKPITDAGKIPTAQQDLKETIKKVIQQRG